jgi:YidB-like protein
MTDISKLSTLLDDPEVRVLIFGLAHVGPAHPSTESGARRLRAIALHLADTTKEQYSSWLSDEAPNMAMTLDQVRVTIGDGAISDLAMFTGGTPSAIAWQLAAVLPDLVDAVSPRGEVIDGNRLAHELAEATADDDRSAGAAGWSSRRNTTTNVNLAMTHACAALGLLI